MHVFGANKQSALYVEDVFGIATYWGNSTNRTITTGVDLSGRGGMISLKGRGYVYVPGIYDTVRGVQNFIQTHSTAAQSTEATSLTAFGSTGVNIGTWTHINQSGSGDNGYVAWAQAVAPKFFYQEQVVVSGSNKTVDLSSLGTVGMVWVKRTDAVGSWYAYHRSATSGKLLLVEDTAGEQTLGHVTLSGTTLTLVQATIGNGTYMVYAWAHDSSSTGIIQCGSYSTDGSSIGTATLGWEPQYVIAKALSGGSSGASQWFVYDDKRNFSYTNGERLQANSNSAANIDSSGLFVPTPTGFKDNGRVQTSGVVAYMAIRHGPMRAPTVGTQVYKAIARAGTSALVTVTGAGFPPDLVITQIRNQPSTVKQIFFDRLRGSLAAIGMTASAAEDTSVTNTLTYFEMDGFTAGTDGTNLVINNAYNYVAQCLRRYPSVFEIVPYTGTGAAHAITHNLGVTPEWIWVKNRSSANNFFLQTSGGTATKYLRVDVFGYQSDTAYWNDTAPTATTFTVGTTALVNGNGDNFIAYLFATLAGISKVGSYTGNGSSLTLNMGFSAGARLFIVRRTDAFGNYFIWDSVRGIVAGNDPFLAMNDVAAEVTTDDSVDPDNSGIIVNENATTHINVNGATYDYLAFA